MTHATLSAYQKWAGNQASSDVDDALLARASRVIDDMTAGVPYPLDGEGAPARADHREALSAAASAQAHYMDETGDASGAATLLGGAGIGSVTLPHTVREGQTLQDSRYAPEAVQELRRVGLLNRRVTY
jgi:hypothetical protein